jgi:hypothetical protein
MKTVLRKMPLGIQDFEKLRTEGCVYVDKTEYLTNCTTRKKKISRPYFSYCSK